MNTIIILIPHYNNLAALESSLLSINESFPVDVLVIDDGSKTKPNEEQLQKTYHNGKLTIEYLSSNQGIERALNTGLGIIKKTDYKYVGRLDCGDFCKKDKFKKQLQEFEEQPDIVLLGSWANVIDDHGNLLYVLKHPTSYREIKKKIYLNSTFVHPTVIFKKEIIDSVGFYPENYKYAEDYAYFFRIIKKFKVGNYPEALLDYVVTDDSISTRKRKEQVKNRIKIIWDNFYFGYYPIWGLIRNAFLLFMSREQVNFIKKIKTQLKE